MGTLGNKTSFYRDGINFKLLNSCFVYHTTASFSFFTTPVLAIAYLTLMIQRHIFVLFFLGNATVADLCENFPETLSNICIQLDDKRFVKNWEDLGMKIGIKGNELRTFKNSSGDSPAEAVLNTIYTWQPDLLLTDMKEDLKKLNLVPGIDEAIANALQNFKGKKQTVDLISFSHRTKVIRVCMEFCIRSRICMDLKFDRRLWKLSPFSIVIQ